MLGVVRRALMNPVTGPIATAIAVALAFAYGLSASAWQVEQASYQRRIAELGQASERAQAELRAQLVSCHAARPPQPPTTEARLGHAEGPIGAKRLLEQGPEGIDACARMESADRAVLSNLKE